MRGVSEDITVEPYQIKIMVKNAKTKAEIQKIADLQGYSPEWVLHTMVAKGMTKYQGLGMHGAKKVC